MAKAKKVVKVKKSKILIAPMTSAEYAKIAKSGKAETVGQMIRALLLQGKLETVEIIAKVKKTFRDSKTKASDVYWNASQLKKAGFKLA